MLALQGTFLNLVAVVREVGFSAVLSHGRIVVFLMCSFLNKT